MNKNLPALLGLGAWIMILGSRVGLGWGLLAAACSLIWMIELGDESGKNAEACRPRRRRNRGRMNKRCH